MKQDELTLGQAIDQLYACRAERLEAEKQIKAMKANELALRVTIKRLLDSVNLESASGTTATTSIQYSTDPVAKDWNEIYAFIIENDAFDMLQRRLSSTAIKDRWDQGIIIPGVEKFDNWDLSLTKRSK
jgi:hypothetical protein